MAELKYPSSKEIDGPWMLSEDQLLSLDEILESAKRGLFDSRRIEIEEVIARESNYHEISEKESRDLAKGILQRNSFRRHREEFTLFMPDGRKLVDNSIRGLLKHQELTNMRPEDFVAKIDFGDSNRLRIDMPIGFEYELRCYDPEIESSIKFELDRWIDRNKPKRVLGWWENLAPLVGFLSGLVLLIVFLANLFPDNVDVWDRYRTEVLRPQAISMIEKGADSIDYVGAISILLQCEFKYAPKTYMPKELENTNDTFGDRQYDILEWEVLLIALVVWAYFHPRPMLGIGSNKRVFNRYRTWIGFLTISVPATFIVTPLAEKIKDWIWG